MKKKTDLNHREFIKLTGAFALSSSFLGRSACVALGMTEAQARARECAEFARAREMACGRSVSRNPYAVLVSETTWLAQRLGHRTDGHDDTGSALEEHGHRLPQGHRPDGYHDFMAPNDYALALQDAACGVDLVNESLLQQYADGYRFVIVPNQRKLASGTVQTLERFFDAGGTVLMTGGTMRPDATEDQEASHLLGLQRTGRYEEQSELEADGGRIVVPSSWNVDVESAEVMASFMDGRPALTRKNHGNGCILWLNADEVGLPDLALLVRWMSPRGGSARVSASPCQMKPRICCWQSGVKADRPSTIGQT